MTTNLVYKLILAGDGGVGKTTLIDKYILGRFSYDTKMTIGVEILTKEIQLAEKIKVALQIWDFGGQERFRFLLEGFIRGAQGVLLLFDLTSILTLKNLGGWIKFLRDFGGNIPIILIGAKADLVEKISVEDEYALKTLEEHNLIKFLKVSAKTGENVEQAFRDIVIEMIKSQGEEFLATLREKYNFYVKYFL